MIMLTIRGKNGVQLYLTCEDNWPAKVVDKKFSAIYEKPEIPTKGDLEKIKEKLSPIIDTFGALVSIKDIEVIHVKDYKKLFSKITEPMFMVNGEIRGDKLIEQDEWFSILNHRDTVIVMIPEESDLIDVLQQVDVSES